MVATEQVAGALLRPFASQPSSHLTAVAADRWGNAAEKVSTFTVVGPCDLSTLTALLDDLQASGLITQRGVYESLRQKLVEAQKEFDKGKRDKAAEKLWGFVEQLDKEAGKGRVAPVGAARENANQPSGVSNTPDGFFVFLPRYNSRIGI